MNATILQAKVEKQLGSVISLRQIFSTSKLRDMATLLTEDKKEEVMIARVAPAPYYPATSGQKRLYALQKLDEDSVSYNISGCVRVEGAIDHARVQTAVEAIAQTQDALRTTFDTIDHKLVQQISDVVDVKIETIFSNSENVHFHD